MNPFVNPEDRVCGNCMMFQQHYAAYISNPYCYYPVNCGFCVGDQTKHRKPTDKACKDFRKDDDHDPTAD